MRHVRHIRLRPEQISYLKRLGLGKELSRYKPQIEARFDPRSPSAVRCGAA